MISSKLILKDLIRLYLKNLCGRRRDIQIYDQVERLSFNGKRKCKFDFVIEDPSSGDVIGIIILDWDRVIGVDVVLRFWRSIKSCGLTMGILVGSDFSEQARARAKALENIFLISKGDLVSYLRSRGDLKD